MAKKKKKVDGGAIAGRIITVIFVILLIGGGYYMYTLFRTVEINAATITGTWKLAGNPDTFYIFSYDDETDLTKGTATSYTQPSGTLQRDNETKYKYEMVTNDKGVVELHMHTLNKRGNIDKDIPELVIKVSAVSKAQMYVKLARNVDSAMTRVNLF